MRELERDDEIKKIGQRYVVKPYFDDDGLTFYATILKEFIMRGAIIGTNSEKLDDEHDPEKLIFEFSNRIGSLYHFCIYRGPQKPQNIQPIPERSVIAHKFIFNSIPLYRLLLLFRDILPVPKAVRQEKVVGFELTQLLMKI